MYKKLIFIILLLSFSFCCMAQYDPEIDSLTAIINSDKLTDSEKLLVYKELSFYFTSCDSFNNFHFSNASTHFIIIFYETKT